MSPPGGAEIPKAQRLGLIAASSLVSESVTFPIDFTKTRMQLAVGKLGFFQALTGAVKNEGLGAVYAGLPPAVLRHWVYTSLRISIYEDLRNYCAGGPGLPTSMATKAAVGFFAGGSAQLIASPTDRLKVLMVKEGGTRSLVQMAKDIMKADGIKGFYVGVLPNVLRASSVNLGELAMYDGAKQWVLQATGWQDGVIVHTSASVVSGFGASLCSTPADVIKSRVMSGQSSGIIACAGEVFRNEGIFAFWKGFLPNWARLGPWQFCFWVSYEQLRQVAGYKGL